jgi:hypothetical protein
MVSKSGKTYPDKDDGGANRHKTVKLAENFVLLGFFWAIHVHLGDSLNCEFLLLELQLIGIRCKALGIGHDFVRECRREQENLDRPGQQTM